MTSAELAPLVVTRAGQPFSDSTVGSDALRIQGYYRQRGFTAVKVTSQVERREPKAGSEFVRVALVIAEGVRSVIDSVTFQGNTAIDADTLRRRDHVGAGPAVLRAADFRRRRQHRAAVSEPRLPGSDGGAGPEGDRGRIEGRARLRHPRGAADSDRSRADRRQPAHVARDDSARGAAQERAAALAAAGRRDAHAHHRRSGCSGASTSRISSFPASRTAATSSSRSRKRR